ncbi:MAG TPA: hypothetical protein ENK06_02975, partial [Gammaproteobacteria bacterium]|nr:hypothetical protein [Gammaproteobacteria bacterium]
MNNIVLFLTVFIFILVIAGWITSEIISSKTTKANNKLARRAAFLEKENARLESELGKQVEKYTRVREEYDKVKNLKTQMRTVENNYRKLSKQFERTSDGIDIIREEISSNKYSNNSVAKEVLA